MNLLLFNLKTDADDDVLGFTTCWINEISSHFDKVFVITMSAGRIDVANNVQVFSIGKEKGYSELRRFIEFYRILFKILFFQKVDVCFAHMIPLFVVLSGPFLRALRIPVVLWYTHKAVSSILRIAVFWADKVVTASKESFRINTGKVKVIGHGIDTNKFMPVFERKKEENLFTILTIGRLSRIKRIDLLIKSLAISKKENSLLDSQVIIVGGPLSEDDRKYVQELKQLVNELELSDYIKFIGSVPFKDIVEWYYKADCFVNLCETGGVDKAVLEAMSCSIPIVVTNKSFEGVIGSELAKDWVVDGQAQSINNRVQLLKCMPKESRSDIGQKLREAIETNYSLERLGKIIADELMCLYFIKRS